MNKVMAVISGGLDSAVALAVYLEAKPSTEVHALTFRYGQSHRLEVAAAHEVGVHFNVKTHIIKDLEYAFRRIVTKGALTGGATTNFGHKAPATYVPGRNFIFISLAAAYAVSNDIQDIVVGVHETDSPYPDCREDVISNFAQALWIGTPNNIALHAPLIRMSKTQVVREGFRLRVPFEKTLTCYVPDIHGRPCKSCDSCRIRMKAFKEADIIDKAYI